MAIGLSPPQGVRASGVSAAAFPLLAPNGSSAAPSYSFSSVPAGGLYSDGSQLYIEAPNLVVTRSNIRYIALYDSAGSVNALHLMSSELVFSGGTTLGTYDLRVARDAANTIAQRNGSNAQKSRTYNRTVSGADEWFEAGWASNVCTLKNVASGASGTLRGLNLGDASTALIGLWGNTPVAQPSGWTIANDLTDRSINFASFTLDELGDVVATLIRDLSAPGFVGTIS